GRPGRASCASRHFSPRRSSRCPRPYCWRSSAVLPDASRPARGEEDTRTPLRQAGRSRVPGDRTPWAGSWSSIVSASSPCRRETPKWHVGRSSTYSKEAQRPEESLPREFRIDGRQKAERREGCRGRTTGIRETRRRQASSTG